jgi:spore coat protein A, manganese oxidase
MIKKKPLLPVLFLALCVFVGAGATAFAGQSPQVPIAGKAIPQFMQPLPLPQIGGPVGTGIYTTTGNVPLTLSMCEFKANILPAGAVPGYTGTWVWGYIVGPTCPDKAGLALDTYTGPVIVNQRVTDPQNSPSPTGITFVNNLPTDSSITNVTFWKYAVDQTLHWADPLGGEVNICQELVSTAAFSGNVSYPPFGHDCAQNYTGPVPAVPHLHGGEVPPELDGGPDAWFTSDGVYKGHGYHSLASGTTNAAIYNYPNTQEAAPIWFHDHLLGGTRLNVYAGLAGAYFIEDPSIVPTTVNTTAGTPGTCTTNCLPANLQPLAEVIPLVLQDRMFDSTGQLFFPSDSAANVLWTTNPEHPYWVPEFVGDTIVVNGKAWPFVNVAAKRYRFLFLNGSNARTYELFLPNPVTGANLPLWVIGTDGGYLDAPAQVAKLVIMPGERYEVIIDFASAANANLILKNTGRTPYPKGAAPQGTTLGQIVQFRVGAAPAVADTSYNPASGTPLRSGGQPPAGTQIVRLTTGGVAPANPALTRQLTLNEVLLPPKTVTDPVTGTPMTAYPGGPEEILVNNTKWSGYIPNGNTNGVPNAPIVRSDFTAVTTNGGTTGAKTSLYSELPNEGATEVWELINLTADAHPIHLHLVQFQIINRQNFNVGNYVSKAYNPAFTYVPTSNTPPPGCTVGAYCPGYGPPLSYGTGAIVGGNPDVTPYVQGKASPPLPQEQGWKDTVVAYPGQVTRLAVRWAPTSLPTNTAPGQLYFPFNPDGISSGQPGHGYVWHCHIVDHEDNEMMRPDVVILNPAAPAPGSRPLVKGTDY